MVISLDSKSESDSISVPGLESSSGSDMSLCEHIKITSRYDQKALVAYIEAMSLEPDEVTLNDFEDRYMGHFITGGDFSAYCIENFCEEINMPSWIEIDYDATWSRNLYHDYNESNGYYFRNT